MTYTQTQAEKVAAEIGAEHGKGAASWYFNGDASAEEYQATLTGIEDGDPMVLDSFPTSPLSGMWADSYSLGELACDTDTPEDHDAFDEVCRAYEDAFYQASADEIERIARFHLA